MRSFVTILVTVAVLLPLAANATDVRDSVWGVWNQAGSPYYVVGDIWVPVDSTLIIEPSVEVIFYGDFKFEVLRNATLSAIGAEGNSILFTTPFPDNGWQGIRFLRAHDSSQLSYCQIEYGKANGGGHLNNGGAIFIYRCSPTISQNRIDTCFAQAYGGGVYSDSSNATISDNSINGNSARYGAGVCCQHYSNPLITGNVISGNSIATPHQGDHGYGGGIYCAGYSSPTISGNTISANSIVLGYSGDHAYGAGIYCADHSNPTITDNTITNNTAGASSHSYGGGIYCADSSNPTVNGNTITGNSLDAYYAAYGGGIYCTGSSNPGITENNISNNSCIVDNDASGGGIYCRDNSSPRIWRNVIKGNTLSGNSYSYGAGIHCSESSPTISENIISDNSVTVQYYVALGAGIYCANSDSTEIRENFITGNFASGHGGGLYLSSSNPTVFEYNVISNNISGSNGGGIYLNSSSTCSLVNNTITENQARSKAGGVYFYASSPTVKNTILWSDTASSNYEMYLEAGSSPSVTYCDVKGGWPGQGNINCYPAFVNPDSGNYHLQMTSCCIDAGDPNSPRDPDGTIADIGAFYFPQPPHPYIVLTGHNRPIVIPHNGGDLYYDAWIYNLADSAIRVDIWSYAYVPGIGQYGPIIRYNNVHVARRGEKGKNNIREHVPGPAPEGEYRYVGYIGEFGDTIIDSSYFSFTKLGAAKGSVAGWRTFNGWFDVEEFAFERQTIVPTHSALMQNYPNPFNARTTINYQLPTTSDVKLDIYNLLGERVATLVDETQQAGYRSVIWDASEVSSGLYFYKLTAGDYSETKRMMLVK